MVLNRSKSIPSAENSVTNEESPSNGEVANQGSATETANQNSDAKDSTAAKALTEFYSILQNIFSYLSAKELNKCAR